MGEEYFYEAVAAVGTALVVWGLYLCMCLVCCFACLRNCMGFACATCMLLPQLFLCVPIISFSAAGGTIGNVGLYLLHFGWGFMCKPHDVGIGDEN